VIKSQTSLRGSESHPLRECDIYLYLQIVFGVIFDTFIIKKIPDLFSLFGASVVIIAGYLNYKLRAE
jgi:drug/metabolite transporter (DMT)-like permease